MFRIDAVEASVFSMMMMKSGPADLERKLAVHWEHINGQNQKYILDYCDQEDCGKTYYCNTVDTAKENKQKLRNSTCRYSGTREGVRVPIC